MPAATNALSVVDEDAYRRYEEALHEHVRKMWGESLGFPPDQVEAVFRDRLARRRGRAAARTVAREVGLEGKRLLDVGSGWGEFLVSAHEGGADVYGVEPDPDEVAISRLLLDAHGLDSDRVTQAGGEETPFADDHFDVVTCFQVLEHVPDMDAVIREMKRVTKPGGAIVVAVPNHLFPYEGHYRMLWPPLAPRWLGKQILRARGRDPHYFLNHVFYRTYGGMERAWRRHGLESRNLTAELLRAGKHHGRFYRFAPLRFVLTRLRLYPNLTWILTKADVRSATIGAGS